MKICIQNRSRTAYSTTQHHISHLLNYKLSVFFPKIKIERKNQVKQYPCPKNFIPKFSQDFLQASNHEIDRVL